MNPSAHFLTRIPQAQARQAAQMLLADQMGYTPPLSTPAFEDLRSLPQDTQRLSTLVEALCPESPTRSVSGRDTSYLAPPGQIRASGTTALGSCQQS